MATEKMNPAAGGGWRRGSGKAVSVENVNNLNVETQPIPIPAAGLVAGLKMYRQEFFSCEYSRELSHFLDCVDQLLLLAERGLE